MSKQLWRTLQTYLQRPGFQVLLPLVLALSGAGIFVFTNRPISVWAFFGIAFPLVVSCSLLLGDHFKWQLVSDRSRLVPRYVSSHVLTGFGLTLLFVALLLAMIALSKGIGFPDSSGLWTPASGSGIFAVLWTLGLLGFCIGYFYRIAIAALFLWPLVLIGVASSPAREAFLGLLVGPDLLPLLFADFAVSIVLVRRMYGTHEEMLEYRWKRARTGTQRPRWPVGSDGGFCDRFFSRFAERSVDRLERPLKKNFRSELQYFQLSHGRPQPVFWVAVMLVGVLWAIHAIKGVGPFAPMDGMAFFFPTVAVVFSSGNLQKNSLQWLFLLPFRRGEIVARLGGSLFLSVLKYWCCFAFSSYFVQWMPIPGSIEALPSLIPLASSLVAQLPFFGIATLALTLRPGIGRYVTVAAMIPLMVVYDMAQEMELVGPLIVCLLVGGAVSIWVSYRSWCALELEQ